MNITDLIEREHGGRNWVIARRTKNILRRYGEDVVTLSSQELRRLEKQLDIETAGENPAIEVLMRGLETSLDNAAAIVRTLRKAGFRIEQIYGERQ